MNVSEELAGISLTVLKDLSQKVLLVVEEILKALILRATRDTDKASAGKNKINALLSAGNRLNAPIKIDKSDVKLIYQMAKEHQIPVAVIKGNEECRVFFRESDLGRVSEMMKEMLIRKTAINERKGMKQIILADKLDARFFKSRAKDLNTSVTFFDNEDGSVKVCFSEEDIAKVKSIVSDLKEAKEKIPKRTLTFDSIGDKTRAILTGKSTLRVYDTNLNKSVRFDVPITKKSFLKNVQLALGYTDKEAKDLASRLESGNKINGFVAGKANESWSWKEDYKQQFSQLKKMEKDIKFSNDADILKNYSFSTISLADAKESKIITIMQKETSKAYFTEPVGKATFEKEVKEYLGLSDELLKEITNKAAKLGFINDYVPEKDKIVNELSEEQNKGVGKAINNALKKTENTKNNITDKKQQVVKEVSGAR